MMKNKKRLSEYYPWAVLGGVLLLLLFLNAFYLENWLDSDMAAEMMFSKLLAEEGRIFASPNWYYSTEFRFLYTHLIMAPLFGICNNWHVIRMITNIIFYFLLLLSYFYMMAELLVGRNKKILGAAVLLLPFSETLMLHMEMGNTYISHVIILFFCLGLFLRLAQKKKKKWQQAVLWGLYVLLSVICGVSGVRYMLVVQGPLVLASVWYVMCSSEFQDLRHTASREQTKRALSGLRLRFMVTGMIGTLCCILGYGINVCYVSHAYIFQTYESTNFIDVYQGVFLERLQDAFGSLLMLFGYIPGKSVLSLRGIVTLAAFLILVLCGYCTIKAGRTKEPLRRFFVLLFYSSFLLNSFVFIFTNSTLVPRYYITTMVLAIPVIVVYFEEEEKALDRYLVLALLSVCLLLATAKTSLSMLTTDKNQEKKAVAEKLTELGYHFGYATYWNGNIVQELSNGQVELASIHIEEDTGNAALFKWASMARYYEPEYYAGEVFLLLTEAEAKQWESSAILQAGEEVCRTSGYVIYDYDSNGEFLTAMQEADSE